jgi:hypothetical protein
MIVLPDPSAQPPPAAHFMNKTAVRAVVAVLVLVAAGGG